MEEFLFAVEAPAIAGQGAVCADDAVARDDDGSGIGGAGAGEVGLAEGASDLRIGASGTAGNFLELLPDAALECGGLHIKREIHTGRMAFDATENFLQPAGI